MPGTLAVIVNAAAIVLFRHVMLVALNPGHGSTVGVTVSIDVPADACHADA